MTTRSIGLPPRDRTRKESEGAAILGHLELKGQATTLLPRSRSPRRSARRARGPLAGDRGEPARRARGLHGGLGAPVPARAGARLEALGPQDQLPPRHRRDEHRPAARRHQLARQGDREFAMRITAKFENVRPAAKPATRPSVSAGPSPAAKNLALAYRIADMIDRGLVQDFTSAARLLGRLAAALDPRDVPAPALSRDPTAILFDELGSATRSCARWRASPIGTSRRRSSRAAPFDGRRAPRDTGHSKPHRSARGYRLSPAGTRGAPP